MTRPTGVVTAPRDGGGWWILRHPDDPTGDVEGWTLGHVASIGLAGAWKAVPWGAAGVTHLVHSYDAAVRALVDDAAASPPPPEVPA